MQEWTSVITTSCKMDALIVRESLGWKVNMGHHSPKKYLLWGPQEWEEVDFQMVPNGGHREKI